MTRGSDDIRLVDVAISTETIRECSGVGDFLRLDDPWQKEVCEAFRQAAFVALEDDPRASRLIADNPKGARILHSQWLGAHWGYAYGAIGSMAEDLTEDEKDAIGDAQVAGVEAARVVYERLEGRGE